MNRVPVILGVILAAATSSAFAQQPQTYHVKKYHSQPTKKSSNVAPMPKTPNATADAAKDLRRIEQQSAKPLNIKPAGTKAGAGSAAFKPDKLKATPPITATNSGGMGTNMKGTGAVNQGKNPYKGRLRQKGTHQ